MEEMIVLSSKNLQNKDASKNYGDCIILYNKFYKELVIFDCGCEEFAEIVINKINELQPIKVYGILSHADSDHIKGFIYMKENGIKFTEFYTILFDKHSKEVAEKLGYKNRTKETIKKAFRELYNSLEELSGMNLRDVYYDECKINDLKILGPSKEFFIEAAAKHVNGWESDNIGSTTIFNAISLQVEVNLPNNKKLLLLGDALVDAVELDLEDYDIIQLPHHGNQEQAEKIKERIKNNFLISLFVSDNTENSNGGSDNLKKVDFKPRIQKNTKKDGDITLYDLLLREVGCYGT